MTYYICPVCGYDQLDEPPEDWAICPCCRTRFDFTNSEARFAALRADWIGCGAPWGSRYTAKPLYWNPVEQLRNIGYEVTDADLLAIAQHETAAR